MLRSRFPFRKEVTGGLLYDPRREAYSCLNKSGFALLEFLDRDQFREPVPPVAREALSRFQDVIHESDRPMLRGRLVHDHPDVLASPTIIELYPNFTCNEQCDFCYVGTEVENASPANTLPREQIPRVAEKLAGAGVFNVTILGGEPFLYHSLDFLIAQLAMHDLDISLSTNGAVKNDEFLDAVKRYEVKLNVALHGPDAETHNRVTRSNSFSKVLQFIESCSELEIGLHLTTVLHPANASKTDDVVKLASSLGVKSMTVSYPHPTRYAKTHGATVPFREYARVARRAFDVGRAESVKVRGNCHYNFLLPEFDGTFDTKHPLAKLLYGDKAGRSRLEMTPSGDLYPTSSVFGQKEFLVGNVFKDDFLDAWANSPVLQRIRERQLPAVCQSCEYNSICGGGIIGENLSQDSWHAPPSDCPILESEVSDLV